MVKPFVPPNFDVPPTLETVQFKLRMLKITDVAKDYEAVITSIDHLQGVFGSRIEWPPRDLSFEQDQIDLGWHHKEFQLRSSFAYTVMTQDESQCLGCVYLFPSVKDGFEVEVYLWVRKSAYNDGLDEVLYQAVKHWMAEEWPFTKVAYPGREISWDEWKVLP